ncbi:MAG: hypothetical protein EBS01_11535 [Verrucomicrobia bacterium]|nr:hypothetical protein [Verrucomicrobiota bacterium]
MRDFEKNHAKNYPSAYASEPAARPAHIPQTVTVDNKSYPVYYDPVHGGYGYRDGSGWRTYEVIRDAVMLGALMQHHNYSYGGGYGSYGAPSYGQPYIPPYSPYYPQSNGMGLVSGLLCLLFLFVIARVVFRTVF